ncbi:MAG: 7-carboxy-7-deazaguanine synthase [Saprospiraceae bacterium]
MASYKVKEIYYTLQGEGARTGRPAVFLRFTGCNLWSGREEDRSTAVCQFCDTDFIGMDGVLGGKYDLKSLVTRISKLWPKGGEQKYVVCTGGEPLLQMDDDLIDELHGEGFEIAIETNGTITVPRGIDWICVSPKANTDVVVRNGNELKLVVRQQGIDPKMFESWSFKNFYLQPMDGPYLKEFTAWATEYCLQHPLWRLSIQTHKLLGIK